jgi:hypothetical protein
VTRIHSKTFAGVLFWVVFFSSCGAGPKNPSSDLSVKPRRIFELVSTPLDFVGTINDSTHFVIRQIRKNYTPDSVQLFVNGQKLKSESDTPLRFSRKSLFTKVGRQNLRLVIYYNDSLNQTLSTRITILSDIQPAILSYKTIRVLPHSSDAYIQGLFYYRGYLYEGTGKELQSRLMKIDPKDGKILMERGIGDE